MDAPARPAIVRPRVRVRGASAGTWLLDDAVDERLGRKPSGTLWLAGGHGSGLRTARSHLERRFVGDVRVIVDPEERIAENSKPDRRDEGRLRLRCCRRGDSSNEVIELAPWTRDEAIEFLLARHPRACASVLQRLESEPRALDLGGSPLVWTAVLEALATDGSLRDGLDGLRAALARAFEGSGMLPRARAVALASLREAGHNAKGNIEFHLLMHLSDWLRQEPVLLALAAEAIVLLLEQGNGSELPDVPVDDELLRAVRPLFGRSPPAHAEAVRVLSMGATGAHPWAASLVHTLGNSALAASWPGKGVIGTRLPRLSRARLPGLDAPDLDWSGIECVRTVLCDARLYRCELREACLRKASLERASLRHARMHQADLREARLESADLERIDAGEARFDGACLDEANLSGASLVGAAFEGCSLHGARLDDADLTGAKLAQVDLRGVSGIPGSLARAGLARANLEGVAWIGVDFSGADLGGALLGGSRFARASFREALLREARLAWIDWEGANLFGADLSGASFHLGSSRSGLVFDAPPGWGTRTGFYTDEMRDLGYKLPEEVRRANLRGADLRKAKVLECDFHLVDLRGALYTPDQEKHFRSCGAILGS